MTGNEIRGCFSETYVEAREKFLRTARDVGGNVTAVDYPGAGINGEPLAIDVVSLGASQPDRTVLVTSGLHGVEGYFGSAVQVAVLQQLSPEQLPEGVRVVLAHGLNPWGFSHRRRFDEQNIDCNRNFLLPGETYAGSPPLYAELNAFLNPPRPPRGIDGFYWQALQLTRKHGTAALQQAIASGQYDFPRGLFFGGQQFSWTANMFQEHWPTWTAGAGSVMHLDLHTGLGRKGEGQCLLPEGMSDRAAEKLRNMLGEDEKQTHSLNATIQTEAAATSAPYRTRGDLGDWCQASYEAGEYLYACLEFGTFPGPRVLKKLRLENQAHHYCPATSPRRARFKRKLLRMFCPRSLRWRRRTVLQAREWIHRALMWEDSGRIAA